MRRQRPAKPRKPGPDISRADFTQCIIALDRGWPIEDVVVRLVEESSKAYEKARNTRC
jgi:hypothetical protein